MNLSPGWLPPVVITSGEAPSSNSANAWSRRACNCGDGLPSLQLIAGQTLVSTGAPLGRPKAANAGLDAVSGEFVMFLDDDDWLSASHVENLVHELQSSPTSIAVYSTTQRTTPSGELLDEFFARDFDIAFLRRDNFMPIHSVLFRSQALTAGCRVDESLDIYEDWDFWLQLSQHTEFIHLKQVKTPIKSLKAILIELGIWPV